MIGKLNGLVDGVGADEVILNVGGVGYLVTCGARTLTRLPAPGEAAALHIETHVREDQFRLFGFLAEEERAWFVRLQQIPGVGAKVALAILDVLTPGDLMAAVSSEDKASVTRASGVGPRLAARVVGELKGKPAPATRFGGTAALASSGASSVSSTDAPAPVDDGQLKRRADAVSALANLGIPEPDAIAAVSAAWGGFDGEPGLDELVKAALKETGR